MSGAQHELRPVSCVQSGAQHEPSRGVSGAPCPLDPRPPPHVCRAGAGIAALVWPKAHLAALASVISTAGPDMPLQAPDAMQVPAAWLTTAPRPQTGTGQQGHGQRTPCAPLCVPLAHLQLVLEVVLESEDANASHTFDKRYCLNVSGGLGAVCCAEPTLRLDLCTVPCHGCFVGIKIRAGHMCPALGRVHARKVFLAIDSARLQHMLCMNVAAMQGVAMRWWPDNNRSI